MTGAALAAIALYQHSNRPLAAVVTVRVESDDALWFRPGVLRIGSGPWASHDVTVDITTDDLIQTVWLYDRYVVEAAALVPAPGAVEGAHELWDAQPTASFEVLVPEMSPGEHRVTLSVPALREPIPGLEELYDLEERSVSVLLTYDVFRGDSKHLFCARADQMLQSPQDFDAELLVMSGEELLDGEDKTQLENASQVFSGQPGDDVDPGPFFDAVEDICAVTYRERWFQFNN